MSTRLRPVASVLVAFVLLAVAPAAVGQGLSPEEALGRMTLPDGLSARVVAAEPLIAQPVCIEFDDRGRLWVIQYLQYPNPAGLRRVAVDRYSRTVYDRVPEPPPHGPKGADRITILEDDDGDGRADRAHDFVNGLNLSSGLAFGNGGVYVLQVPYLLFYPDRDRDDVPDADPEVLLEGFGMEDAHSVANSLTWGPDGWLYGLQGSTVTANVRGVTFQQGVWRYHPKSRAFELFTEGGGNMWGLDFDRHGRLLASTNVGAHALLHAVQGAWCWKSFAKHGDLHNPYAYGYFDHAPHRGSPREGHVTVGGLLYEADNLPPRFRGTYIAGDLLGHAVRWHEVEPLGSTVRTRLEGDLIAANDPWFATSDLTLGPDGAVYVADWHDRRTAHPDPDADWDRSNGRVYAVHAAGARPAARLDLGSRTDEELLALLDHPNSWFVRRARKLLAERGGPETIARLKKAATAAEGTPRPIEAVWTLAHAGAFDPGLAATLLDHPDEDVRAWTVRLIGDRLAGAGTVNELGPSHALIVPLRTLAATDPSPVVRAQLAASARRLPPEWSLDILTALVARDLDGDDLHIPLLLWWALERDAVTHAGALRDRLGRPEVARTRLARREIVPRLIRRLAAEGTDAADGHARLFFGLEPTEGEVPRRLAALDAGLRERPRGAPAPGSGLPALAVRLWREAPADPLRAGLAARLGSEEARTHALRVANDRRSDAAARVAMIRVLAESGPDLPTADLLRMGTTDPDAAVAIAAVDALGRDGDPATADAILAAYPARPAAWQSRAREVLLGRRAWARAFLEAVDAGRIDPMAIPVEALRPVASHGDPALDAIVLKHWGRVGPGTPEEKLAEVRRLNNDVRASPGDPARGREVFLKHCATCHTLFGEGKAVGPDLTQANRSDREFLLVSLVDPSAVVRKEYRSSVVATRDGRVLTGIVAETGGGRLAINGPDGARVELPAADVESVGDSPVSLMPEGLYRQLSPDDLRDLFGYLQGGPPR